MLDFDLKLNAQFEEDSEYITTSQLVAEITLDQIDHPEVIEQELEDAANAIRVFTEEIFLTVSIPDHQLASNIAQLHKHFYMLTTKAISEFPMYVDATALHIYIEHKFRLCDQKRLMGYRVRYSREDDQEA